MSSSKDYLLSLYSHREYCVNYLIQKTKCIRAEAEDIFIESVLDIQEKNIDLNEIVNLRSYLVVTSLNYWKRLYNKTKKQNGQNEQISRYFYHYLSDSDDEEGESQLLENRYEKINSAFENLGDKCRRIISLFYLEGHSMQDIANKMGFNTSLVATTVKYRCMNRLKKIVSNPQNKKDR